MKFITSTAALLFLLAGSASGKRNILGNILNDPTKAGVPTSSLDAATGTVLNEDSKKDMSCDGQLAAALVEAKELASKTQKSLDEESHKHKLALESIVDLQKNLAKMNADLLKEKDAFMHLKASMDGEIQAVKDRSSAELEAITTKAKEDLEALRNEKDEAVNELQTEAYHTLKSHQELAHNEFQELKSNMGETIANLEAKLKMSTDELQEQMRLELKKAKEDKDTKVAQITADKKAAIDELIQKSEMAGTESSELLKITKETAEAQFEEVKADRDEKLQAMAKSMEMQEETSKQEMEKVSAEYEEKLSGKITEIETLQQKAQEMADKITTKELTLEEAVAVSILLVPFCLISFFFEHSFEKIYDSSLFLSRWSFFAFIQQEITHWRTLHAQRSYCNVTHVAIDFYDASASVAKHASDKAAEVYDVSKRKAGIHVSNGLEYSSRVINEKFDEHWPTVAPYYDDMVTGNYEKIAPHLQDHVYPALRQASDWTNTVVKPKVLEAIDDGKKTVTPVIEQNIQVAADVYEGYCRSSLTEFLKATEEVEVLKEHPPPSFLLESWETSCEKPRDSIIALSQGTAIFFALIFWRRIMGLAWGIVKFFLLLFVKLTPLRFFLPRKPAQKELESPPPSPTSESPPEMAASHDSLMKSVIDDEIENDVEPEGEAAATLY